MILFENIQRVQIFGFRRFGIMLFGIRIGLLFFPSWWFFLCYFKWHLTEITHTHTQEFIGVRSELRVQWSKLCNLEFCRLCV